MPNLKIADLNTKYLESESADRSLFSEQRTNILLVTGNHYSKNAANYLERLKTSKQISNETKIRLTKNHISRITKIYYNSILTNSPMVKILPNNEKHLADAKSAELHQAVWDHAKKAMNIEQKIASLVADFIDIGEAIVKIHWEPEKGIPIPYQTIQDEEGNVIQEVMQMSGECGIERVFGFNFLRDCTGQDDDDCKFDIIRKMVDKKLLENKYKNDPEKLKFIQDSAEGTYVVFNNNSSSYEKTKGKVLIREFYFKPNFNDLNGYYYITTNTGILEEGELPGGIYPILYVGFDRITTTSRHQSIIKQLRPYQGEINRTASKMAEHQITVGDDKVFIQAGTKIANGGTISGIRGIQYTGLKPEILEGRSGAQYLDYMLKQIEEMYQVADVQSELADKPNQLDPYSQLFQSMKNKKKFMTYADNFGRFFVKICETVLKIYKLNAPEGLMIPIIGKDEMVNMSYFKNQDDLNFQITVEQSSSDLESLMGKQLTLNHILQYSAGQMDQDSIGQVIRNMPFVNKEQILGDLTINYDNATNIILAMDKGQPPYISPYDDKKYILKKITHRVRQSDFQFLPQEAQQAYGQLIQFLEQGIAQQVQQEAEANLGFIPTGGPLIGVDFYVNYDAKDPTKTRRARVPMEAVSWLFQRLDTQGMTQETLNQLSEENQASIGQAVMSQQQAASQQSGEYNQMQ